MKKCLKMQKKKPVVLMVPVNRKKVFPIYIDAEFL